MIERTTRYYLYDELDDLARQRALQQWQESQLVWNAADPSIGEDKESARRTLAGIGYRIVASVDDQRSVKVTVIPSEAFVDDVIDSGASAIADCESDGYYVGEGIAELWNGTLAAEVRARVNALDASDPNPYAEIEKILGNAAEKLAESVRLDIESELGYFFSEEGLSEESENNVLYFEEDGSIAEYMRR